MRVRKQKGTNELKRYKLLTFNHIATNQAIKTLRIAIFYEHKDPTQWPKMVIRRPIRVSHRFLAIKFEPPPKVPLTAIGFRNTLAAGFTSILRRTASAVGRVPVRLVRFPETHYSSSISKSKFAIRAVQPVWCEAPRPCPVSP
jgi:hypothetical protein